MLRVKIGKDEIEVKDRKVESKLLEYLEVKAEADKLANQLKELKDPLLEFAAAQLDGNDATIVTIAPVDTSLPGLEGLKVTFGIDVKIGDVEKLEKILGDRFDDLVKTEETYKPENKLKEMAVDDEGLRECLVIKDKTPSITVVKVK